MIYEVINPSDPITFDAPDLASAFLALQLVGKGWYAGESEEGPNIPMMPPLRGSEHVMENYLRDTFNLTPDNFDAFVEKHTDDVILTLKSFVTGKSNERYLYESALNAIDDENKKKNFIALWDDKQRSSLNDITNRAHGLAASMEKNRAS